MEASFVDVMECLAVPKLPEGPGWTYEIKLDGYRMEALVNRGQPQLLSRRNNSFNAKYPSIAQALTRLPDATILDGEIVALDEKGHPDFNALQNYREAAANIRFILFDCLMVEGRSLLKVPLGERREVLTRIVRPDDRLVLSAVVPKLPDILHFARAHALEGIIAKREESLYEPGKRSGAWCKHRFDSGQEFVVGGYTKGSNGFDALIVGFYREGDLQYAARVRAGFVPATRRQVFARLQGLKTDRCPFVNLPEQSPGRWGQGLTAEKMRQCVWVDPKVVVRVDFLGWTEGDKLRHTKFVGIADDKDPQKVVRES